MTVSKASAPVSQGDIFVAPQFGPTQDGPMILDPKGKLIWFDANPLANKEIITDFRVQNLHGQRVLTWFQGSTFGRQRPRRGDHLQRQVPGDRHRPRCQRPVG